MPRGKRGKQTDKEIETLKEIAPSQNNIIPLGKTDILISGYVKNIFNKQVPQDLLTLIAHFVDAVIGWIIAIQRSDYRLLQAGCYRDGPTFIIRKIPFTLRFEVDYMGYAIVSCYIMNKPDNIEYISIKLSLYCHETNTQCRTIAFIEDIDDKIGWKPTEVLFSEAVKHKELSIKCKIDILAIKYKGKKKKPYTLSSIKLNPYNQNIQFEWNIDHKILTKLQVCRDGITFWPETNFGISDNFCIYMALNGPNCCIYLQLLALPYPLKRILVSYKMEMNRVEENGGYIWESLNSNYIGYSNGTSHLLVGTIKKPLVLHLPSVAILFTLRVHRH